MTTTTPERASAIDEALAKMQGQLEATAKGGDGQVGGKTTAARKYKYSTIADVWDAVRKPLSDNGLSITQTEGYVDDFVTLTTTLRHVSGETISGVRPIASVSGAIKDPQAYGSALTYARRYGITAMVGIAPADDDDGVAAKRSEHHSMGRTVAPGSRGGQDKSAPAQGEIKLRGFPEDGTRVTKTYPRKIGGAAAFLDDLEIAVEFDPMNWDTNSEGIEAVMEGIEKAGRSDLRDRLANIEVRAADLARNPLAAG